MRKTNVSLSARHEPARAFIKCLVILIMEANSNNTKKYRPRFSQWMAEASPFLSQFRIKADFSSIANRYMLGRKVFDQDIGADLGILVKEIRGDVNADNSISKLEYDFINNCANALHRNSDAAWNFLLKNVPKLGEPDLTAEWLDEDEENDLMPKGYDAALAGIKRITFAITNKAGEVFLPMGKEMELRKSKNEKQRTAYFKCKKVLTTVAKNALKIYMRQSHKSLALVDDVRDYMAKNGIANDLPRGFSGGQIDEYGTFYTREGKMLDKVITGQVILNKAYDPTKDDTYVLKSADPDWRCELRTITGGKARVKAKFNAVQKFIEHEDGLRSKWVSDIKKDGTRQQIWAAMCDIMWNVQARIGGTDPRYPTGNKGLSTVTLDNLAVGNNTLTFDYAGKKGTLQHHVYKGVDPTSKKVIQLVKSLLVGKSDDDLVFTYGNDKIYGSKINTYLKSLGFPEEFTNHKFRHVLGTKLFMSAIADAPFDAEDRPSLATVNKWLDDELKKIGQRLHHQNGGKITGTTARNSYIDREVFNQFYTDLGLRPPKIGKDED